MEHAQKSKYICLFSQVGYLIQTGYKDSSPCVLTRIYDFMSCLNLEIFTKNLQISSFPFLFCCFFLLFFVISICLLDNDVMLKGILLLLDKLQSINIELDYEPAVVRMFATLSLHTPTP